MKKNLMKKAHELTKKIVAEYGDVDYRTQLGLCLSFLSQEGGKEMKGTEKQIKFANDLKEKMHKNSEIHLAELEKKLEERHSDLIALYIERTKAGINYIDSLEDAGAVIENLLHYGTNKLDAKRLGKVVMGKYRVNSRGLAIKNKEE